MFKANTEGIAIPECWWFNILKRLPDLWFHLDLMQEIKNPEKNPAGTNLFPEDETTMIWLLSQKLDGMNRMIGVLWLMAINYSEGTGKEGEVGELGRAAAAKTVGVAWGDVSSYYNH